MRQIIFSISYSLLTDSICLPYHIVSFLIPNWVKIFKTNQWNQKKNETIRLWKITITAKNISSFGEPTFCSGFHSFHIFPLTQIRSSASQYIKVCVTYRSLKKEFNRIQMINIDVDVPFLILCHTQWHTKMHTLTTVLKFFSFSTLFL